MSLYAPIIIVRGPVHFGTVAAASAPAFRSDSVGADGASAENRTVSGPAGTAENDIVVIYLFKASNSAVTPATGFTEATGSPYANTAVGKEFWLHVFWKREDSSPDANYTFSWTGAVFTFAYGASFSGCTASGSPFDIETTAAHKTTSADSSFPDNGVTTSVANTLVVWAGAPYEAATASVQPSGYTEHEDSGTGNNAWACGSITKATAGSQTSTTSSYTGNVGPASTLLFALKP